MTTQATDFRIIIEPVIVTPAMEFGPSDSVPANAVLLTSEKLRTLGAYPARSGRDWDCKLWILQTIASVETAVDLTGMALAGTYWDDVTRAAVALTITTAAGTTGLTTISFAAADLPTAGMYRFLINATETEVFDLCSGWLEILPAQPAP